MTPVSKGRRHYSCMNAQRKFGPEQKTCLVRNISAPLAEDAVMRMFASIAQHEDFVAAMQELSASSERASKLDRQKLAKLSQKRRELITTRDNLVQAIGTSKSAESVHALTVNLDSINDQKAEIEREIHSLSFGQDFNDLSMHSTQQHMERSVQTLLTSMAATDRPKLKEILRTLLYGVIVTLKSETESEKIFTLKLALRYSELEQRHDGTATTIKMEVRQEKHGSRYTIISPFMETRDLSTESTGAETATTDAGHPLHKLTAYLAEVENMRPAELAKKIGHTRAHVSQILSLRHISAKLRRRILTAKLTVSSRFSLNRLLAIAKLPPSLQEKEVAAILGDHSQAA